MRTTVTLDDPLEKRLRSYASAHEMRFKQVLNEALQHGLDLLENPKPITAYKTKGKKVGLRGGLSFDGVSGLLEHLEGPHYK